MRFCGPIIASTLICGLAACEPGTDQPPTPIPTTLSVTKNAITFDALTATEQIAATVKDQNGATISGASVSYDSDNPAVATVSATGLVTAVDNGTATVTVTSGSLPAKTIDVTVAQVPAGVTVVSGDAQTGEVAVLLPDSLVAKVTDRLGRPIASLTTNFSVSANGGTVAPTSMMTNASGDATTQWTLGTAAGAHTVTATPATGAGAATFNGTATAAAAATVGEVSGGSQTAQAGLPLPNPLVVTVQDQYGNPVAGTDVDFTVTSGTGTVQPGPMPVTDPTDANGEASVTWTLGPEVGMQSVDAAATGLTGSPVTFTATATSPQPASVEVYEGDNQAGLISKPVNFPPAVLVKDLGGNPFSGATVTFAVTNGGGSGTGLVTTSDVDGIARVGSWTLGASPGTNMMTATVTGSGITNNPITFSANGQNALFDIDVRFVDSVTSAQRAAFQQAEQFWEALIIGDLPNLVVNDPGGSSCAGITLPAMNETVDDVVIYAELVNIDGPFGVLGQAGPCFLRSTGLLTVVGGMRFDTADLNNLEAAGELDEVILHEMGHVLGIGTLWPLLPSSGNPYLKNPSDPNRGGTVGADTYFDGPLAIRSFDDLGGASYPLGKVPVENDNASYGTGSLDGHWREGVFATELMTPELNSGVANPLSQVTVASLADLGYVVNYSDAESFVVPGPAAAVAFAGRRIHLHDDIWHGPMLLLDPAGRVVGVIQARR